MDGGPPPPVHGRLTLSDPLLGGEDSPGPTPASCQKVRVEHAPHIALGANMLQRQKVAVSTHFSF